MSINKKIDHVVYVDTQAKAMENLLNGKKKIIIRGGTGRKMPYGRVNHGDILYLINNNAEGLVKAKCVVKSVFESKKMTKEESTALVEKNKTKLQLSDK